MPGSDERSPEKTEAYFETKYGKRRKIIPGFADLYPNRLKYLKDAKDEYETHQKSLASGHYKKVEKEQINITFTGYWGRLAHILFLYQQLSNLRLPLQFDAMLDIGTGAGIHPAIARGVGLVKTAHGNDLIDRVPEDLTLTLAKHDKAWHKKALVRISERARNTSFILYKTPDIAEGFRRASILESHFSLHGEVFDYRALARFRFKQEPRLDKLILGDIYSAETTEAACYDLVTSFNALTLFDIHKLLPQIVRILKPSGIFYFTFAHWWCIANAWGLVGDLPMAAQRLEKDDYLRFIKRFHPGEYDLHAGAYEYFPENPYSLQQIIDLAERHGLIPVYSKKFIPRDLEESRGVPPFRLVQAGLVDLHEIEEDIRCFRGDVFVEDLLASRIAGIFIKRPALDDPKEAIKGMMHEVNTKARPVENTTPWFKIGKRVYGSLLAKKK